MTAGEWDRIADGYHAGIGDITTRTAEPLIDLVGVRSGDRLLDAATGPGYLAAAALKRGAVVTAVDLAAGQVRLARWFVEGADLHVADIAALPFRDASFDVVVAGFVLTHLPDPVAALAELVRVTRPGGVVGCSTWGPPERVPLLSVPIAAIADVTAAPAGSVDERPSPPAFRYGEPSALGHLLEGAGLARLEVRSHTSRYRFASTRHAWDVVASGTVRTAARLFSVPARDRARVRARFEARLAPYATARGLELPITVLLASGRRPAATVQAAR